MEHLRDMFSKFGLIHRLVMPAHCLTAIIEFADPSEARTAFTKLAYSKFHNAPLYLEWAPDDTFVKPYSKENTGPEKEDSNSTPANIEEEAESKEEEAEEPDEGSTLFVKNLNF